MTSEPRGAYSAKVDTGLVTKLRARLLIEGIFIPLTGFHLGGPCFRGYSCLRENFARPKPIA